MKPIKTGKSNALLRIILRNQIDLMKSSHSDALPFFPKYLKYSRDRVELMACWLLLVNRDISAGDSPILSNKQTLYSCLLILQCSVSMDEKDSYTSLTLLSNSSHSSSLNVLLYTFEAFAFVMTVL